MKKIDIACIVDDDPIFVYGAKRMMELADFCNGFMIFNNGHDALHKLKALIESNHNLPDLILLDLNMPNNGLIKFNNDFPSNRTYREKCIRF